MKICPFISHMIGENRADILQIDSPERDKIAPTNNAAPAEGVVILGYDGGTSVGVQTKPATAKKPGASAPSHLFCLKETCRFYMKQSGACKIDTILELAQEQTQRIEAVERHSEKIDAIEKQVGKMDGVEEQLKKQSSSGSEKTATKIAKELDKFWKFQTKSVAELISSLGEAEKKQERSLTEFKKEISGLLEGWTPEVDLGKINDLSSEIQGLHKSIDSREEGIESFATTVSDLVMNIDETLKTLREKHDALAGKISELEAAIPRPDDLAKKIEETLTGLLGKGRQNDLSGEIESIKNRIGDVLRAYENQEARFGEWQRENDSRARELAERADPWREQLDRIEKRGTELLAAMDKSKEHPEDESVSVKKKEARKYNNLGVSSYHNSEFELAREQFVEAVSLDPDFAECWNNLGLVYTELQQEDDAKDAFSTAIKLNPDLPAAYNNLGYIHYKRGDYDQAIVMYTQALNRSSDSASAYINLGNAYFKRGDREEARTAWEKALEIDPENEKARRNLKRLDKE